MKELEGYVWKGSKSLNDEGRYVQEEHRLIDMSEKDLKDAYNHCKTMLFNKDSKRPGRYNVLSIIADQKNRCGAELFLRYVEREQGASRITLVSAINEFLNNNKEAFDGEKPPLNVVFNNLPDEFTGIPLDLIIDGCLDRLGALDRKHITRAFILRQGVWLTPAESKDLIEKDHFGEIIDRIDVIRERLNIKDVERLSINSRGLNYTELRAMMNLKPNKKYRDLTTVQLETLRNRILFTLEETVGKHIVAWENRMVEIEKVANYKKYKI